MNIFDIINSINNKTPLEWDEVTKKAYVPFMINRGLSFNMQTVMFANAMNMSPHLDKQLQYDFYFTGVPKGKRWDKWQKKPEMADDIIAIKNFYHINNDRAAEALKLLTNEQLTMIKNKLNKGGRK